VHVLLWPYTFELGAMREETGKKSITISRRRLLGGVGAALVLGGSAIALVRTGGYSVAADRKLLALSPWQFVVVQHAARRIAASDRPDDTSIPTADDLDVAGFVDAWSARLPDKVRRDLGRFLAYLEHLAPVGTGHVSRFTSLSPGAQEHVLSSVESSSSGLLRAGFDGLKSLVFMGYYRDPRTWKILGYDGPLISRPRAGWWK
jgi:hypothetical protein